MARLCDFESGVMLRAWVKRFGGFSGLVERDGELLIVSDAGAEIRLFPHWGQAKWRGRIRELPKGCFPGTRKQDRDSEALAMDPATGMVWVGLELINSVCRYTPFVIASEAKQSRRPATDFGLPRFARNDDGSNAVSRAAPAAMADCPIPMARNC